MAKTIRRRVRGGRVYQYNQFGDLIDSFGRTDAGDVRRFRKQLKTFVEDDRAWELISQGQELRQKKNAIADELNQRITFIQKKR